jgi:hypothetical protein
MNSQETFRKLLWSDAPLFHQPFWLDAVAPDQWDAAVLEEQGIMKAYYLYALRKSSLGLRTYMPELTQFLGPGYRISASNERERLKTETAFLEKLCSLLPPSAEFISRWQTGYFNWLPFHWMKYKQRVRYTYVLDDISNPDALMEHFSDKITREIKKAEKVFTIGETNDVEKFYQLIQSNFRNKQAKVQVDLSILQRAHAACKKNNCGKIWYAADDKQQWAAAVFIAWDAHTAYYIIGAKDDSFGNSGAMTLLFRNAFKELKSTTRSFDFEGSMIKGVEHYFRSFGASQRMFFEISYYRSFILKMKNWMQDLRG